MKNSTQYKTQYGPWALVTGGSAGIGNALASQLADRGLNIVLAARDADKLEKAKQELESLYDVEVRTVSVDLTQSDAVQKLNEATSDLDIGLVIPNAGAERSGEFVDEYVEINTDLIALNVTAPMQIANVFGARLKKRGSGGILFVSSLVAYQGVPYLANYAATKAYILTLSEALTEELAEYGVDVSVLSPGLTDTEMSANAGVDFDKMPMLSMSPERAARIGLNALGRKATVVPGFINKVYAWENRFIPRTWPVKLFKFLVRRALKEKPTATPSIQATA